MNQNNLITKERTLKFFMWLIIIRVYLLTCEKIFKIGGTWFFGLGRWSDEREKEEQNEVGI